MSEKVKTSIEVDERPWRHLRADAELQGQTVHETLSEVLREYYLAGGEVDE